jgi:PBP1b-binding outer membrane lipoprotein LpoB
MKRLALILSLALLFGGVAVNAQTKQTVKKPATTQTAAKPAAKATAATPAKKDTTAAHKMSATTAKKAETPVKK